MARPIPDARPPRRAPIHANPDKTTTATTDNDLSNEHMITDLGDIAMTTGGFSDMILIKLSRVGGNSLDTAASDVRLLELDIHYEVNTFGTADEYSR